MRVVVDNDLCERNAICTGIAPEVFELEGGEALRLLNARPGEELRARLEESVRSCPAQAISIES